MIAGIILLTVLTVPISALTSPCPNVFHYEILKSNSRWHGEVDLSTNNSPQGLLLDVKFDRKVDSLGTWAGEVSTEDNINFRIENSSMPIRPGAETIIRFYVQYESYNGTPTVTAIMLNGREICYVIQQHTNYDSRTTNNDSSSMQCGTVVKESNSLILQGRPTKQGEWPWQTALYVLETVYSKYICGGTLVGQRHVVTAAHCVTKRKHNKYRILNKNTLTVYLGKHNLRTTIRGVQIKLVEKIIVHPEYKLPEFKFDIAIIELKGTIEYTDWVRPVCLWPETLIDLENIVSTNGWVVGWGLDESGLVSEELNMVQMPVVSQETCLRSHVTFYTRFTSDYTYCAGNRNGSSVCNGDSGGGMVFQRDSLWYLRGVVSLSLAKEKLCDPKNFVIFTDVAKLLPWVKQNIN